MNTIHRYFAVISCLVVASGCARDGAPDVGRARPIPSPASTFASPSSAASSAPEPLQVVPIRPPASHTPQPSPASTGPGILKIETVGAPLSQTPNGAAVGRLRPGVLVPFTVVDNGWAKVITPCELTRWIPIASVIQLPRPEVVLDPGHGGAETGATGPSGLSEKTINLTLARKAADLLEAGGVATALTRTDDYRATLGFRAAIAASAKPALMISIHHNADPDGKLDHPGTETYYQIGSAASKRMAGLMYEEAIRALAPLNADWVGDTDAGAKWRPNSKGGDYYGILRMAGLSKTTAILAEMAFVSNPSEEALLAQSGTSDLEAQAVSQAVKRFLNTKDPGSGFTVPYPRKEPAGPGGGRTGCRDPS